MPIKIRPPSIPKIEERNAVPKVARIIIKANTSILIET
jgi:hypothetical protein